MLPKRRCHSMVEPRRNCNDQMTTDQQKVRSPKQNGCHKFFYCKNLLFFFYLCFCTPLFRRFFFYPDLMLGKIQLSSSSPTPLGIFQKKCDFLFPVSYLFTGAGIVFQCKRNISIGNWFSQLRMWTFSCSKYTLRQRCISVNPKEAYKTNYKMNKKWKPIFFSFQTDFFCLTKVTTLSHSV